MPKHQYPDWLAVSQEPIFWAFKRNPEVISRGRVMERRNGRVYLTGKYYGLWADPDTIIQLHDVPPGKFAD